MTAAYARVGTEWQRVSGSNLTLGTAHNQAARGDHTHPIADTGWIAAPLVNAWVDYGSTWETCAYRRVNGIVYLRGLIKSGNLPSQPGGGGIPYRFFTLPAGFRPGGNSHTPIVSAGVWAIINIHTTGEVAPNTNCYNSWLSLANVSFPADN